MFGKAKSQQSMLPSIVMYFEKFGFTIIIIMHNESKKQLCSPLTYVKTSATCLVYYLLLHYLKQRHVKDTVRENQHECALFLKIKENKKRNSNEVHIMRKMCSLKLSHQNNDGEKINEHYNAPLPPNAAHHSCSFIILTNITSTVTGTTFNQSNFSTMTHHPATVKHQSPRYHINN